VAPLFSWPRRRVPSGAGRIEPERGRSDAPRGRVAVAFAASLAFEGVERRYGEHFALRGITLAIEPGEVVCLLGPSGCGKTTLLRIASGIEKPTAGRVTIDGSEVAGPNRFVPPEKRNVGLVFQDFALFPHLSILDNVAFGLQALAREDARREAAAVLARVGLARYADAYPHILSGGEQQRVALARAIAPRPALMLMDEPFSGLDVQLRESLQEETLTLLEEARTTSLIVTHHPEEAMRLANRIAVLRAGRIEQVGRVSDLYGQPVSLFVARLFSEINEIPCRVEGGALRTPVGTFSVPDIGEGEPAVLCIRQRAVRLVPPGEGLPARVLRTRFLGDAAILDLGVSGFENPLKARVRESEVPAEGQEIAISIDPQRVLVFRAETSCPPDHS
jgi:iron(III) transport system ATP-binding protein